jgi:hypothetical protein
VIVDARTEESEGWNVTWRLEAGGDVPRVGGYISLYLATAAVILSRSAGDLERKVSWETPGQGGREEGGVRVGEVVVEEEEGDGARGVLGVREASRAAVKASRSGLDSLFH